MFFGNGYGYGFGYGYLTYYLFMLPGLILALWANSRVKSAFNKYSNIRNIRGMTGRDAAENVLRNAGIFNVSIERVSGNLTDHYDPRTNVIRLSDSVYDSASVAAIGVAAHEAGHAVQYATGYSMIKLRTAILPVCGFGSKLGIPLVIIGTILSSEPLMIAGVVLFSAAVLFQLVTLPVEFNASNRALHAIKATNLLYDEEYIGAKKVLSAAAMTYVAAMLQSMLILLYYIMRINGNRRN